MLDPITAADVAAQAAFHAYHEAKDPEAQSRLWRDYQRAEAVHQRLRGDITDAERLEAAAHDAADWRMAVATGDYTAAVGLPDVPLADPGDWFVYPEGVGR